MNNIKLTPRLQCVADSVKKCNLLADIGTDHAYIPIYAAKTGLCQKAIASDVVKGPLKIASDNILSHGLEDKITTCLANGLASAKGADVIVIAGMGGKLIADILKENINIAKSADYLVLQPMTCSFELRKFLHGNGFVITDEKLAQEDEKIYNIMVVKKGADSFDDEFHYYIGKKLFENKSPLLARYIKARARVIKKQFTGMMASENAQLHKEAEVLKALHKRFIEEAQKL